MLLWAFPVPERGFFPRFCSSYSHNPNKWPWRNTDEMGDGGNFLIEDIQKSELIRTVIAR